MSPQALVATVVGAAVAALVGKLTAYLFVAVAIFLFAVASAVLYSRAKTPAAERFRRRFLLGASLTAALLACGTLAYGIPNELTKGVRSDEKLVSSLSAGQDLSRFRAALGPPDTKRPSGAFLVYQFQRSRATLQAVVNRVGEVVSYAVYAKKTSFSPSFDHGLRITLNRTTVDDAFGASSVGANLYCGAHKAGYFEGFGGFNAVEARYFVLGVSDANTTEVSTAGICKAVTGGLAACNFSTGNELSSRMLACVKSAGVGRRLRSTLKANVYIETAPGLRLLPAMLYPPDEAANLGS